MVGIVEGRRSRKRLLDSLEILLSPATDRWYPTRNFRDLRRDRKSPLLRDRAREQVPRFFEVFIDYTLGAMHSARSQGHLP